MTFAQTIAATKEDTEKTLMHFHKGYTVFNQIKIVFGPGVMPPKECINGIWKNRLESLSMTSKDLASKKTAKNHKRVVEIANGFNLAVDVDEVEELLEVVPEELTNKALLGLKEKFIGKDDAREKEVAEEKEEPPRKFIGKGFIQDFPGLSSY